MLELSVCIETIFADLELPARIDAVADAGLRGFEIWGWQDKDLEAIIERKDRHGLELVNLNLDPPGHLLEGDEVPAFVEGVRESCQVARRLGCPRLTAHVQEVPWGEGQPWYNLLSNGRDIAQRRARRENIVEALKQAVPIAQAEGILLMLEPLNSLVDHAGYFLSTSREGFDVLRAVDSPGAKLLFDVYHNQVGEGNLINNIVDHIDLVGHLHLADAPGRHEPGTGEINFLNVLLAAKRAGYDGYVGLEYIPRGDSLASLEAIRSIIDQVNRSS